MADIFHSIRHRQCLSLLPITLPAAKSMTHSCRALIFSAWSLVFATTDILLPLSLFRLTWRLLAQLCKIEFNPMNAGDWLGRAYPIPKHSTPTHTHIPPCDDVYIKNHSPFKWDLYRDAVMRYTNHPALGLPLYRRFYLRHTLMPIVKNAHGDYLWRGGDKDKTHTTHIIIVEILKLSLLDGCWRRREKVLFPVDDTK